MAAYANVKLARASAIIVAVVLLSQLQQTQSTEYAGKRNYSRHNEHDARMEEGNPAVSLGTDSCDLCILRKISDTKYEMTAPPSPNGQRTECGGNFMAKEPRYLEITTINTPEYIFLDPPGDKEYWLDETNVNKPFTLISACSSFEMNTIAGNGKELDVVIDVKKTDCHKVMELKDGATGTLEIKANYPTNTMCEWWIRAPEGKQVNLKFETFDMGEKNMFLFFEMGCKNDFVLIDSTGDTFYGSESKRYCGDNVPETVTSTDGQMNVLVDGRASKGKKGGLKATYKVV